MHAHVAGADARYLAVQAKIRIPFRQATPKLLKAHIQTVTLN